MTARDAFGPALRTERERRGVTLESIARTTKVSRSLFVALEANNLSRWPLGIYRRSFFRDYVTAIGLPPEPLLAEFLRLFPESGQPAVVDENGSRLTITLVPEGRWKAWIRRGLGATLDAAVVLGAGYGLVMLPVTNHWAVIAGISVAYYTLSTLCLGQSLGCWCMASLTFPRPDSPAPSMARQVAALRQDLMNAVTLAHPPVDGSLEASASNTTAA